ncbi:heparinase II/III domain-containing protein [Flavicella sediminum]|uniref:heparinase II/III domain-containing protein n=1 Tax=Flavicella sediminum TaxID=2585141 RepID=UPI00111D315E|nr:heparinase II/III family protein [Flavicella sediminum]
MKNRILLIVCCLSLSTVFAQKRNYLLYTDTNIANLKKQIATDTSIQNSWEAQLKKADDLLEKGKYKAADCQVLGLAYRMTGEEKYAKSIKEIVVNYTSKETWEGQALLNRTPAWKGGLGTSHTSFFISIGYDCIYNYLSNKERKEIAQGIVKVGIQPAMADWLNPNTSFHTFDTMGHNWWSACVYMAGFSSLAVRNEISEATTWVREIALTATDWVNYTGSVLQNKPSTFDKDGGFYESINYASYGISQYLLFRYALGEALPNEKQVALPILDKVGDFFIKTTYYVGEGKPMSVNFGDSAIHKNGNGCMKLLWQLGYTDAKYAWYLNQTNKGNDKEGLQLDTPNGLILNPILPKLKEDFTPELATSHLFKDMGWATLRNSWKKDATMLAVKSGFTWNHTQADAGSYILFHKGKNLIIDSGNSSYGNPLYTQYYCQSEAHNVVLFNGEGQNRKDPYFGVANPGSLHNLVEGSNFKYLLANATGPYSQILARNYRNFIWVGDVILVIDDLLAHKPGKFEWLLHYNGTSKRQGHDLSIKEENSEVLVRSLFPETFPSGGLPHDFPEQMQLEEKIGYKDHHPEKEEPYWAISHFNETARTKFISALILKTDENKENLPVIKRFEGKDFLGVSMTQNGETTQVYFNLLAGGRLKHRNSVNTMNGWETDAYLTVLKFKEGADTSKHTELEELFIGHGSYLRKKGQTLMHSLSKYTALVEDFKKSPKVIFQGQATGKLRIYSAKKKSSISINQQYKKASYQSSQKLLNLNL